MKMKPYGFKLIDLYLTNNGLFEDIDFAFYDTNDNPKEPYSTLLIGPNGTGKSNLLRIICLLFQELNELKQTGIRHSKISGNFIFNYALDNKHFTYSNYEIIRDEDGIVISRKELRPRVTLDGDIIIYNEILLPENIISLSMMITDRFPTQIANFHEYSYLGVRSASNTARTTSYIRKTVSLLIDSLNDEIILENISKGLQFLDYEKYLYVSYIPRYKHVFFSDSLNEEIFSSFFLNFWEHTKRDKERPPWSLNHFKKIIRDNPKKIKKLVTLCKKIKDKLLPTKTGGKSYFFGFDIFERDFDYEEIKLLNDLHLLDVISYPSITFRKADDYFEIEECSSGEYHFISGFISLLAKLSQNSLVLIDEPESSLHPNWQMKYISFLKGIFSAFSSCHFIISTHSHFLVSDLKKASSNIIALSKDKIIRATPIPTNTFGWSAEEILLKVFKTPSSRNFYLTEELNKVFELISSGPSKENVEAIKEKMIDLKKYDFSGLSDADPLKDVVFLLFKKFDYV
jgi:predicted ATP-dependent endonuclease of OLD family